MQGYEADGNLMFNWAQKPLLGQQINWGHPLTIGLKAMVLFNEKSGDLIQIGDSYKRAPITSPTYTHWKDGGLEYTDAGGSGLYPYVDLPTDIINPFDAAKTFTIFTVGAFLNSDNTNPRYMVDIRYSNSRSTCLLGASGTNRYATTSYAVVFSDGSPGDDVETVFNEPLGAYHSIALVGNGPASRKMYVDGVLKAVNTSSVTNTDVVSIFRLGVGANDSSQRWEGIQQLAYFYDRPLTDSEIFLLNINPYAMFQDSFPVELMGVVAAGGGKSPIGNLITPIMGPILAQ